jgi:hypothetical protein
MAVAVDELLDGNARFATVVISFSTSRVVIKTQDVTVLDDHNVLAEECPFCEQKTITDIIICSDRGGGNKTIE